jgi:hypothetical protein
MCGGHVCANEICGEFNLETYAACAAALNTLAESDGFVIDDD